MTKGNKPKASVALSVHLTPSQHKALKKMAAIWGCSLSTIVRNLCDDMIRRNHSEYSP